MPPNASPRGVRDRRAKRISSEIVREAAARGLLGITIPQKWGGGGRDHAELCVGHRGPRDRRALRLRRHRQRQHASPGPSPSHSSAPRRKTAAVAAAAGVGPIDRRFALSEEHAGSDAANQQTVARLDRPRLRAERAEGLGRQRRGRGLVLSFAAHAAGDCGSRGQRVPRADGCARARRASRRPIRSGVRGLGCMDLELRRRRRRGSRCSGAPGDGFGIVAVGPRRRPRGDRRAGARRRAAAALDEARRAREVTRTRSVSRSATTRRSSGCSRTWPPSSMPLISSSRPPTPTSAGSAHSRPRWRSLASEAAHRAADKPRRSSPLTGYRRGSVVERLFRDVRAEIYQGTSGRCRAMQSIAEPRSGA